MSQRERGANADQRDWRSIGKYAIQRKPYTIAKYFIIHHFKLVPKYGLWKDGVDKALGYFDTADLAKERVDGVKEA